MGLKFRGLEEFRDAFTRLRDESEGKLSDTVRQHMESDVFPRTQERVPVASGRLKETGRVERGDKPTEHVIWYGDSAVENDTAVDYAAAVHEIEEHRHEPPTSTKYVEEPLRESVPRLQKRAAQALEDVARG